MRLAIAAFGLATALLAFSAQAAPPRSKAAAVPTSAPAKDQPPKTSPSSSKGKEPQVVEVKEEKSNEGVKTYVFSAVEVEGRLRSPQVLYFLRRLRAESQAHPLGHRSFMRELKDTRRSPALR